MRNAGSHLAVAGIIWLSAVVGFLASYVFAKNPRILSLGNTFGGGVLLAAGLVHLTNDAFEIFESADEDNWSKRYGYPWAAFFVCSGFLVTLVIEVTVLQIIDETRKDDAPHFQQKLLTGDEILTKDYDSTKSTRKPSSVSEAIMDVALQDPEKNEKNDHHHFDGDVINRGMVIAIVFLFAISCHSFLAGLGIGALNGKELWSGMIAIIAHKSLATFTLANCFINANCTTLTLTGFIFGFSLVTPLGILCGALISNEEGPTEGVLIGLAGGSFLYIGIIEVISKEVENQRDWMLKLLMLIMGWALMSLLALWV